MKRERLGGRLFLCVKDEAAWIAERGEKCARARTPFSVCVFGGGGAEGREGGRVDQSGGGETT